MVLGTPQTDIGILRLSGFRVQGFHARIARGQINRLISIKGHQRPMGTRHWSHFEDSHERRNLAPVVWGLGPRFRVEGSGVGVWGQS